MGLKEDINFSAAIYYSVYNSHLDSLQHFEERTVGYRLLDMMQLFWSISDSLGHWMRLARTREWT